MSIKHQRIQHKKFNPQEHAIEARYAPFGQVQKGVVDGVHPLHLLRSNQSARCPHCGRLSPDIEMRGFEEERTVKDVDDNGALLHLVFKARKIYCPHCQSFSREHIDWLPERHSITTRLISCIQSNSETADGIASLARKFQLSWNTVSKLRDAMVQYCLAHKVEESAGRLMLDLRVEELLRAPEQASPSVPEAQDGSRAEALLTQLNHLEELQRLLARPYGTVRLMMDEFAIKRGHRYATAIVTENGVMLDVLPWT